MRRLRIASLLLTILAPFLLRAVAGGQSTANPSLMQVAKLTASDGSSFSQLGTTSGLSGDTAVVGPTGNGAEVYVYVKGANGWSDMTETAKLVPSDGTASFGQVAISGDTIVVGSPGDFTTGVPAVYVFVKPSSGWSGTLTETAILTTPNANFLGTTVAINDNTIVAGGFQAGGQFFVFVKPAGGWKSVSQDNATLVAPFSPTTSLYSIAIGGNVVAVGAPNNFGNEGTAYLFVQPSAGWSGTLNPTATLAASNGRINDNFGSSVAISSNGSTVVAGASNRNFGSGAAYIFVEPGGGWVDSTETAQLTAPHSSGLGSSVGISGNTVVAGAPFTVVGVNQFQGALFVYRKPSSGWKSTWRFNFELSASDGAPNDILGYSSSIDSGTILAGAPQATIGSNQFQGAAYVFAP